MPVIDARRFWQAGSIGVGLVLSLSACGETTTAAIGPSPVSHAPNSGSVSDLAEAAKNMEYDSQYELLQDGEASKSDYEEAAAQAVACMKKAGLVVAPIELDLADSLSLLITADPGSLSMDEASELMIECLESKVAYVEDAYLSTHDAVMDPSLLAASAECLSDAGIELSGEESNISELKESAGVDREDQVIPCVGASLQKVSPGSTSNLKG